jgi:hypothetical protein
MVIHSGDFDYEDNPDAWVTIATNQPITHTQ